MNRAKRRWKAITVVTAAPVAGLLVAASMAAGRDGRHERTETYRFPDEYVGPVWVEVPESDGTIALHLEWGSWGATWDIEPSDARAYWFSKADGTGEDNPPIVVTVRAADDVQIGYGQLPLGARVAPSDSWYLLDGAGPGTPDGGGSSAPAAATSQPAGT